VLNIVCFRVVMAPIVRNSCELIYSSHHSNSIMSASHGLSATAELLVM